MTHWQSPYMHAYFPALNSYPALLGDFLATGLNCIGFTWVSIFEDVRSTSYSWDSERE
jgi:histidine decarboxylase